MNDDKKNPPDKDDDEEKETKAEPHEKKHSATEGRVQELGTITPPSPGGPA
jgi:hypothetical protein